MRQRKRSWPAVSQICRRSPNPSEIEKQNHLWRKEFCADSSKDRSSIMEVEKKTKKKKKKKKQTNKTNVKAHFSCAVFRGVFIITGSLPQNYFVLTRHQGIFLISTTKLPNLSFQNDLIQKILLAGSQTT